MGTKKKKLIYLAPDIDLSKNEGGKVHTLGEIKYLQEHFDSILVICQNKNLYKLDNLIFPKIKTFIIPHWIHKPLFRIFIESPFFILYSLYLRVKGYKYLIERSYRFGGWFSFLFSITGGQTIYQLNEVLYYNKFFLDTFTKLMTKILNLVITSYYGTHSNMSYLCKKEKIFTGWWGVDSNLVNPEIKDDSLFDKLNIKKNDEVIIYIGSGKKWHNISTILKCAEQLPQIIFIIITSGKIITKQNILNNVRVLTDIPSEEIVKYINISTIGLALYEKNNEILKRFDYFYSPIKVHEYKACGKPVIATKIGNLITLVQNTGILINNDVEELKNAIIKLTTNNELYQKYSQTALEETQEKYNYKKIAEIYYKLFINAL